MAGDKPINVAVFFHIRIEKIQRDPSNCGVPRLCDDLAAPNVNGNRDAISAFVKNRSYGEFRLENVIVRLFLPTVVPELLTKITVPIE